MQSQRRPLVAGNWKMNGNVELVHKMQATLNSASFENVDVLICPPFPFLSSLDGDSFAKGAQNMSQFANGAHTGEISAAMLNELGCQYVLVGHSERRQDNNETDEIVALKAKTALENKIVPVLCVGETESIRENGSFLPFIASQLDKVIAQVGINSFAHMVIAYEPVWAIGTGKTASPEQAQEVHGFIREHLAGLNSDVAQGLRILYGGSVKAANAKELFSQPDIDGGLIGGASLDPQEFLNICLAARS